MVVGGQRLSRKASSGSVAADWCAGLGEAVEGLLLEGEVGVQVDHGGVGLLVTEPKRDHGGVHSGVQTGREQCSDPVV
jgi:hypothetical protein